MRTEEFNGSQLLRMEKFSGYDMNENAVGRQLFYRIESDRCNNNSSFN